MLRRPCAGSLRVLQHCSWDPRSQGAGYRHAYRSIATTTATTLRSPQIHILGLGSIGTFAAHTLADVPARPALKLLLHRRSLRDGYNQRGNRITLETREGEIIEHSGYDFETISSHEHATGSAVQTTPSPSKDTIDHLIVCVKSTQTVPALRPLLTRLTPKSSILFLQNGAGMIEDVNENLWPDPETRPSFITGVISHGVTLKGPFDIKHTGPAATSLGPVPRDEGLDQTLAPSTAFLLDTLPRAPRLNCQTFEFRDILQRQLEKLAVNAFSNPLTALANSTVEYLFSIPEVCSALMREISSVIFALPELQGVPGVEERFSARRLEDTVMEVIVQNRSTTCSMVWDMRAARETEIRYINGYWARRGREIGVATPINDEIVERIQAMTIERQEHQATGTH
jgi:2-dehydropantoate 2-reductase